MLSFFACCVDRSPAIKCTKSKDRHLDRHPCEHQVYASGLHTIIIGLGYISIPTWLTSDEIEREWDEGGVNIVE
jgi:hypothetical protein